MPYTVFVSLAFAVSFLTQVVIWRVNPPKKQILAVLGLFTFVFIVATIACGRLALINADPVGYLRLGLLYGSMTLVYAILFSAVEIRGVSFSILNYIADMGPQGCPHDDLIRRFLRQDEMMDRLKLMEVGGSIRLAEGRCELTTKGRFLGQLFYLGAKFFGLSEGG